MTLAWAQREEDYCVIVSFPPMSSTTWLAAPTKFEAECATSETHRLVALDAP